MTMSPSMTPFTRLLARLVELLGADAAANLAVEFSGKTIAFPAGGYTGAPLGLSAQERAEITGFMHALYPAAPPLMQVEEIPDRRRAAPSPLQRRVTPHMTVVIDGTAYDASRIPGVSVGDKITLHPQDQGYSALIPLPPQSAPSVYREDAKRLGEGYQRSSSAPQSPRDVHSTPGGVDTPAHTPAAAPVAPVHPANARAAATRPAPDTHGPAPQCGLPARRIQRCSLVFLAW